MSTTLQAAPAADAYLTMFNDLEAELARHSPPFVRRLRRPDDDACRDVRDVDRIAG